MPSKKKEREEMKAIRFPSDPANAKKEKGIKRTEGRKKKKRGTEGPFFTYHLAPYVRRGKRKKKKDFGGGRD